MVKKSKPVSLWIACILFLLLSVLFFSVLITAESGLPRVLEYSRSRLSQGITFATVEKVPNESYSEHLAVCAETETAEIEGIGEVKPVLVNEHYFDVYGIYVGGSAVTAEHVARKASAIVISDKAAFALSLDADVVGQTVTLWEREFTVVGIYRKPGGILREASSDIYERVYVPYTCYDGYRDVSVDTLAAPYATYSKKALPLLGMTGTDTDFYIENDLGLKHDMIAAFRNWYVFLIAVLFAVCAVRIVSGLCRGTSRRLREAHQKEYVSSVLKRYWPRVLMTVSVSAVLIAVPAALIAIFPPRLVLPQSWIPYDNIFEIRHYIEAFIGKVQLEHAGLAAANGYYRNLFSDSMLLLASAFGLLIVLSAVPAIRLNRIISHKQSKNTVYN